ncbi:flagellar assembly protein FliH [Herminiimonas sp. CN]|uniref:flagellar assembly protein FliH n=1 Tax=Herminiimonas sp. CN TaxID=1349818 RepID=UPI001EE67506|nr:flagellar assembly protein FliH [Herminiimonas sp. CN]
MSSKPPGLPPTGAPSPATYQMAPRRSVPKEQMTAWQRWEMASFNEPEPEFAPPPPAAEPVLEPLEPVLLIDEAELARLRLEARQAGEAEGRREGFVAGHSEGYAAGLTMAQEQAQALRTLMLALPAALRAAEREVADDVLTLALDIARQVVRQALPVEPQPILALVRELLHAEPALNGTPRLLLHADDAALVRQHLADDLQAAGWRIRTDLSITRGGCRVHAASGALDATLETRLERVAAALGRSTAAPAEAPEPPHD